MVGMSVAIIAVILALAAMIARSGRRMFSAFTLPFISIPVLHLVGTALRMSGRLHLFDIAGLVIGLLLSFLFSRAFRAQRSKLFYFVFCCCFLVALLVAYLIH